MAYDLSGKITLDDGFSSELRRIAKEFSKFRENIKKSADDLNRTARSANTTSNRIAESADEARQLSRRMEDTADNTEEATRAAIAYRAAMAGISNAGMGDVSVFNRTAEGLSRVVTIAPLVVAGLAGITAAAAPLTMAVGGLAASLAAAGIGAVAFGAVAVSSLGKVFEASEEVAKIQEKIDNATTAKERIKAEKELAQVYEGMSKAQQGAVSELQKFQSFWSEFTARFDEPVFKAFSLGLEFTQKLLSQLQPTIQNVADVVVEMMESINKSVGSSRATEFFEWLENNAAESIRNFATAGANLLSGLFGMFKAFAPVGASVEEGLVGMTERFKEWGLTLQNNKGFQNFIAYAKENTPVLIETFKQVWDMLVNITRALAPLGTTVLATIGKIAGFVNEHFSTIKAAVTGLLTAFIAFRAITTIITIVSGVVKAFQLLTNVFKLVKNAFTLLRLALLLFPGGWIVIAIGAVVAAGIALYKNWDVVKEKAGQLWSWIKEKWSAIKDWTVEMWGKVKTSIGDAMDNAKQKVSDFFSPLLSFIDDAKARFDKLVGVVKNFKMPSIKFPSLPSWMGGGKEDGSYRTGAYRISEDGHKAILHKGESVLTAGQSNTLRSMGVLQARGNRPVLNTEPLTQTRYKVQKTSAGGVNIDRVNITINGAQKTTKEMTREMVQELKYAISAGGLA